MKSKDQRWNHHPLESNWRNYLNQNSNQRWDEQRKIKRCVSIPTFRQSNSLPELCWRMGLNAILREIQHTQPICSTEKHERRPSLHRWRIGAGPRTRCSPRWASPCPSSWCCGWCWRGWRGSRGSDRRSDLPRILWMQLYIVKNRMRGWNTNYKLKHKHRRLSEQTVFKSYFLSVILIFNLTEVTRQFLRTG